MEHIAAYSINLAGCIVVLGLLVATLTRAKLTNREYVDLGDYNASDTDKQIAALIRIRRLYDESKKESN